MGPLSPRGGRRRLSVTNDTTKIEKYFDIVESELVRRETDVCAHVNMD